MQNVESKPCDICGDRSTSYSSGHGRWCDKHSPLPNFNPDLKGRRAELKQRIRDIILWWNDEDETSQEVAEKILQEIEGRKEHG